MRRLALWLVVLAPLSAAAQTYTYLDHALERGAPAHTALLITPIVTVNEISAGGMVEKIPEWSRRATHNVSNALRRVGMGSKLHFAELPALDAVEQHALDQHVALFDVVASQVHRNRLRGGELWAKRLKSGLTDYTLGPGLAFLADKTGADTALVVIARDAESSGGRKAMAVFGVLFGVVVPPGPTFIVAGLVDLRSGRLLWQSYDVNLSTDLREPQEASRLVEGLFKSYPAAGAK